MGSNQQVSVDQQNMKKAKLITKEVFIVVEIFQKVKNLPKKI